MMVLNVNLRLAGLFHLITTRIVRLAHTPRRLLALIVIVNGILLPASIMQTDWYAALAQFVAVNTLLFGALAVAHLLPAWRRDG